jgi:hypothetical protein
MLELKADTKVLVISKGCDGTNLEDWVLVTVPSSGEIGFAPYTYLVDDADDDADALDDDADDSDTPTCARTVSCSKKTWPHFHRSSTRCTPESRT